MPKFVFLATDLALLLLLAGLALYVGHARRSPDLRTTWRVVVLYANIGTSASCNFDALLGG